MYKLGLERAEEPEIKLPTFTGSQRRQGNSRKNIYFNFIDYEKAFDCVDQTNWRVFKEMGIVDHRICLLRNLYSGQEATVRTKHGTTDRFKIGKEYKAVYCYTAYLACMQSTSYEMLDWMNHKLESRMLEEISITSDMQMTPPLWHKAKNK